MTEFCDGVWQIAKKQPDLARRTFYEAAGTGPLGTKVLSLFLRDCLQIASFPVDRHVRRLLVANSLPVHEGALVSLCQELGLETRQVATGLIKREKLFMPNPIASPKFLFGETKTKSFRGDTHQLGAGDFHWKAEVECWILNIAHTENINSSILILEYKSFLNKGYQADDGYFTTCHEVESCLISSQAEGIRQAVKMVDEYFAEFPEKIINVFLLEKAKQAAEKELEAHPTVLD